MLPEMTDEQRKEYFTYSLANAKEPNYMMDILDGKIHIWDVPFEYRFDQTYIYACRSARISAAGATHLPDGVVAWRLSEQKLIENTLLSDIMECDRRKMPEREESLREVFYEYFSCGGMNATGLI